MTRRAIVAVCVLVVGLGSLTSSSQSVARHIGVLADKMLAADGVVGVLQVILLVVVLVGFGRSRSARRG
jgi:hypothetical protein